MPAHSLEIINNKLSRLLIAVPARNRFVARPDSQRIIMSTHQRNIA
jgi:hypothetical protein